MMKKEYTATERKTILDRIFQLFEEDERMDSDQASDEAAASEMRRELDRLCEAYLSGIPEVTLSRCPFTGKLMRLPIDTFGLDGLWWNSDSPLRPPAATPESFLGIDGALSLGSDPEKAPFLAAPGPDRPFVIPRLLQYKQVKAVISSVRIGAHTGYPVTYYADPQLYGVDVVNDWGADGYWAKDAPELPGGWRKIITLPEDRDYDLAGWIKRGKVLWIMPEDPAMTLRSHLALCPYLELPGDDRNKYIQNGVVWRATERVATPQDQFNEEEFLKLVAELEGGKK